MSLIRFDNSDNIFDSNLLTLEPIEEKKKDTYNYYSIPIRYNGAKVKIRLPKTFLQGIYFNEQFMTFSLFYPYPNEEMNLTTEQRTFKKWIDSFEKTVKEKALEAMKGSKLRNKPFTPLFQETKSSGLNMFIKFASSGGILNQKCYDFKGNEQDINKVCTFDREGDYLVIIDVPSVYISGMKQAKNKALIQVFGDVIFTETKEKEQSEPQLDVVDVLGKELLS